MFSEDTSRVLRVSANPESAISAVAKTTKFVRFRTLTSTFDLSGNTISSSYNHQTTSPLESEMSFDHCTSGHLHAGDPHGKVTEVNGWSTYVTGPESKVAILYVTDVFGYKFRKQSIGRRRSCLTRFCHRLHSRLPPG